MLLHSSFLICKVGVIIACASSNIMRIKQISTREGCRQLLLLLSSPQKQELSSLASCEAVTLTWAEQVWDTGCKNREKKLIPVVVQRQMCGIQPKLDARGRSWRCGANLQDARMGEGGLHGGQGR